MSQITNMSQKPTAEDVKAFEEVQREIREAEGVSLTPAAPEKKKRNFWEAIRDAIGAPADTVLPQSKQKVFLSEPRVKQTKKLVSKVAGIGKWKDVEDQMTNAMEEVEEILLANCTLEGDAKANREWYENLSTTDGTHLQEAFEKVFNVQRFFSILKEYQKNGEGVE